MKIRSIYLICLLFAVSTDVLGQTGNQEAGKNDREILLERQFEYHVHHREVKFGFDPEKNWFVKYNPVSLLFSSMMYTYQKWISPQISSNCYYKPTCSEYSKLLYKEYNFVKATMCTADRLMRCDRISAASFDPISINPKDGKIHETTHRYTFDLHEK
jgi:putative membrane protein insertion efficiency factor